MDTWKDSSSGFDLQSVASLLREILFVFHRLSRLPSQNFVDGD